MSATLVAQPVSSGLSSRGWLAAFLLLSGPLPLVWTHFSQLWGRLDYRCFPLIVAASFAILWRDRPRGETAPRRWDTAAFWWLLGLLLVVVAFLLDSPWLGMLSFWLIVRGCLVRLGYQYFGGWWLGFVLLPLPLGYDQQFTAALQTYSTKLSSRFLDWLQVPHLVQGNTLRTEKGQLMVAQACSGISSLVALTAFAAAWSAWLRRSPIAIIALAAVASFWAVLMNSVRIAAVAWASVSVDQDWSTGTSHELLGLATFLLAAAGLWSTEPIVLLATAPIGLAEWRKEETQENPWVRWWNRFIAPSPPPDPDAPTETTELPTFYGGRLAWSLGIVSAVACLLQMVLLVPLFGGMGQSRQGLREVARISKDFLPAELDGFDSPLFETEKRGAGDEWGEHTRRWKYNGPFGSAVVSVDFPFLRWHELPGCYVGLGWKATQRETHRTGAGEDLSVVNMEEPLGQRSVLAYTMLDDAGAAVTIKQEPLSILRSRLALSARNRGLGRVSIQVQCLLTPSASLDEESARALAESIVGQVSARLRDRIQSVERSQN